MEKRASFAKELTAILIKLRLISEKTADELVKSFKNSPKEYFDDFLLEENIISRPDLLKALSLCYKVPAIDVVGYFFQPFLLNKFPKDILHRYGFIPMDTDDEILTVVASEPDDSRLLPIIGEFVSYDIVMRVGIRQDITDAITEYYDLAVTQVPDDVDMRIERMEERGVRHETFVEEKEDGEAGQDISDQDVLD